MMLLLLLLLPAVAAATATSSQSQCTARTVDPMFRVLPAGSADGPPPELTTPLAAARGEAVHLQVAVTAGRVEGGARASVAPAGLGSGVDVTVRAVAYIDLTLPAGVTAEFGAEQSKPGLFPDALVPLDGADADVVGPQHIAEGAPQVFWLTLAVPRNASAGVHHGHFRAGACVAAFALQVSDFALPPTPTQLTGASFQAQHTALWTSPQCTALQHKAAESVQCNSAETAFNFFRSLHRQHINTFVFHGADVAGGIPWQPSYEFTHDRASVTLNTTAHDLWWPRVLSLTKSTRWRLPFSTRFSTPAKVANLVNATWGFVLAGGGEEIQVPVFDGGAPASGKLNPTFVSMFKILFGAVMRYLDSRGWGETGSYVQIIDEPNWSDAGTLAGTLAIMRLYQEVDPRIKIYQTRFPSDRNGTVAAVMAPVLELVDWWAPHV